MLEITGQLVEGRFLKRLNRFEAIVNIDGVDSLTHVPNTGRLKELLVEDARVFVRKYDSTTRKTKYGLLLVERNNILISIDSANVPNKIVFEALMNRQLKQFERFQNVHREITVGSSRFDFALTNDEEEYFIEVKGVTLVEEGKAYFPDAPTVRGTRHLEELTHLKQQGKGAGVIFIIQREDAEAIMPNDRTDKDFGQMLRKAFQAGVEMWAYRCSISQSSIDIFSEVPVILPAF